MLKTTFLMLLFTSSFLTGQTNAKAATRPVLMPASRLATLCRNFQDAPVGYAEKDKQITATPKQIAQALGCISYIEGVTDKLADDVYGEDYTPQGAQLTDAPVLVDLLRQIHGNASGSQ